MRIQFLVKSDILFYQNQTSRLTHLHFAIQSANPYIPKKTKRGSLSISIETRPHPLGQARGNLYPHLLRKTRRLIPLNRLPLESARVLLAPILRRWPVRSPITPTTTSGSRSATINLRKPDLALQRACVKRCKRNQIAETFLYSTTKFSSHFSFSSLVKRDADEYSI